MNKPHISVCICTYKRPAMLKRLLESVADQQTNGLFDYSVVVVDNDTARSGESVVADFAKSANLEVGYHTESNRNIALARNKSVAQAKGELIAFIDDDEFPVQDWLLQHFLALQNLGVAAVLGPVRPHFDTPPPQWVIRGRFCERAEFPTGRPIHWNECRTGNVLFCRAIIPTGEEPFREQFGTGGEDKDFFMRMSENGCRFAWCNEAVVFESVPAARCTRAYMLNRALLRGQNSLKLSQGRLSLILKSFIAVPAYSVLLPFTLPLGHHRSMNFCIRLCDHLGRVLTLLGLRRTTERQM